MTDPIPNPVSDAEGDRWAASPAGTRTRAAVGARTAHPPRTVRWLVPVTAVVLVAATVVWLRHDSPAPVAAGCPVTATQATPFSPPSGRPTPPIDDALWIGDEHLWTVLDGDGGYSDRKSVWWSVDFPGGAAEEQPPLTVTALQLDGPATIGPEHAATNAYTVEDGWFMIADFPLSLPPGCWEVTGSYKGATLSYVVEVVDPAQACPATVMDAAFTPPEPYPATPPDLYESDWYGTADLWTMIPHDGARLSPYGDKLFFWSRNFVWKVSDDFYAPDLTVTATRLDRDEEPIVVADADNGTRFDIGTFILTGIELPTATGCYEITAEYRGTTLSYVARVG